MNSKMIFAASLLATFAAAPLAAQPMQMLFVQQAGASQTSFWDVNNAGTVVGSSLYGGVERAFTWTRAGGFVALAGPDGAYSTTAFGISDTGLIVGSWVRVIGTDPGTGLEITEEQGFLFDGSSYVSFAVTGAVLTELRGVSPNGRYLAGWYYNETDAQYGRGFVHDLQTGAFSAIGAGGNDQTTAQGVNNSGQVVGSDWIRDDETWQTTERPGFVFDATLGTRTDYLFDGQRATYFRAIDENGSIAGWVRGSAGDLAFYGGPASPVFLDRSGYFWASAQGNNDAGWIVGNAGDEDRLMKVGYLAMPVPEPATWLTLAFGLAAVGRLVRVRR